MPLHSTVKRWIIGSSLPSIHLLGVVLPALDLPYLLYKENIARGSDLRSWDLLQDYLENIERSLRITLSSKRRYRADLLSDMERVLQARYLLTILIFKVTLILLLMITFRAKVDFLPKYAIPY